MPTDATDDGTDDVLADVRSLLAERRPKTWTMEPWEPWPGVVVAVSKDGCLVITDAERWTVWPEFHQPMKDGTVKVVVVIQPAM